MQSTPKTPSPQRKVMHDLSRNRSLRLPSQPAHIPIPPTLLQSPYLNSPQSIFQRAVSTPRLPTEEDEQWLQDTIPLHQAAAAADGETKGRASTAHGPPPRAREPSRPIVQPRPSIHVSAPASPPLVHHARQPSAGTTPASVALGHHKRFSESNISYPSEQGYFSAAPLRYR